MVIGVAVCLLMLGVVFRAVAAGDFLWLDEQHTAWVVQADLANVAGRAADGNQTPLFFYACWSALKIGGESALSLRLPSLICGLCLTVIVPLWVWRHTASAASLLIVAAWVLFDYDAVFYASEARPYAMVQLLGAVQAAVFFAWISPLFDSGHRRGFSWLGGAATAVLAALIFYTHPTGMSLMFAEIMFVLGLIAVHRAFPWKALLGTAALCASLILPGVIMIAFVWQRRENWTSVTDVQKVFSALAIQATLLIVFPLVAQMIVGRFLLSQKCEILSSERRLSLLCRLLGRHSGADDYRLRFSRLGAAGDWSVRDCWLHRVSNFCSLGNRSNAKLRPPFYCGWGDRGLPGVVFNCAMAA